ncbi:MAG: hypothetical protein KDI06_23200, partial [Calditrichaeota bacterium]|nr:hypothetical protein [Calditrichota bacterium]
DLFENGAVLESGATTNGFASLSDTRHGILLAARYFWEKNPRGISLSEDGTLIYEAAAEPDFLYAGMGSGDELLLHFHPNSSVSELQSLAEGEGRQPLQGLMRSGDYAAARPFYALSEGFPARWPGFAAYLTQTTANHFAARENLGLYGSTNFGDMIAIDGGANAMDINASGWGNNYYDGLLLTPARLLTMGAERRYLDILIPGARHWMESDAWQSDDPDDWMNGYCPAYSLHHRDVGHFQHHYGEGVWAYYYLSGDERAREVGLNAANSIIRQQAWGNENTGCRQAYQRASACLEAYKATTDPAYLAHARL